MSVVADAIAFWEAQGLVVFDGEPPDAPPAMYVIVVDSAQYMRESLGLAPTVADWKLRTRSVGTSAAGARWVRERVKRIVGQVIAGCVVEHEFDQPLAADDNVPGSRFSGYDQFAVTTTL